MSKTETAVAPITLKELEALGLRLKPSGTTIIVSPSSKLTNDLRQRIAAYREPLLAELKEEFGSLWIQ